MKYPFITAALITTSLLAGCASLSPPPARPAYSGSDTVDQVDPTNIVGNWSMRILNPREDEEMPEQTMQFNSDGSAIGRMKNLPGMQGLGDLEFETTGNWKIAGDIVTTSDIEVRELTGNNLGGLMTSLVNTQTKKLSGTANIMEVSNDRMIWSWDGDGAVVEYTRLE